MAGSILSRCRRPALFAPRAAAHRRGGRRWPSLCAVCRGWGRGRVCADCLARFAPVVPRCRRCALAGAGRRRRSAATASPTPPPFDAAFAARRLRLSVGPPDPGVQVPRRARPRAGARRGDRRGLRRRARADAAEPLIAAGAAGAARLRERGYNQAWELARRLAPRARLPRPTPTLLLRLRDTPHQLALPPRASAPATCAAPSPSSRAGAASCAAARVALVDDVMTTGAHRRRDRRACCKQAGAARVEVWVVARTPRPGGSLGRADVQHRPGRAGDPAQHRQRDPARGQHRLRAAPGRAARLLDGRPAAAPRRPRLPRVRRRAAACVVAGVPRRRSARRRARCSPSRTRRQPRLRRRRLAARRLAGVRLARPPACRRRCATAFAAGAAGAPADARRPAQPEPEQRRRGGRVRGLAPERLRRRRSERPRALSRLRRAASRRISSSSACAGASRPSSTCDHRVDDRHLDAARAARAAAPSARCARPRRRGRARRRMRASGMPCGQRAGRRCGCATGRRWRSAPGRRGPTGP